MRRRTRTGTNQKCEKVPDESKWREIFQKKKGGEEGKRRKEEKEDVSAAIRIIHTCIPLGQKLDLPARTCRSHLGGSDSVKAAVRIRIGR